MEISSLVLIYLLNGYMTCGEGIQRTNKRFKDKSAAVGIFMLLCIAACPWVTGILLAWVWNHIMPLMGLPSLNFEQALFLDTLRMGLFPKSLKMNVDE